MFSGNRSVSMCYDIVPQQPCEVIKWAGVLQHELEHNTQITNSFKNHPLDKSSFCGVASGWIQKFACQGCLNFFVSLHLILNLQVTLPVFFFLFLFIINMEKNRKSSLALNFSLCIQSTKLTGVYINYLLLSLQVLSQCKYVLLIPWTYWLPSHFKFSV